jgi:uncharacterized LabA/DUF88 family protein
MVSLFIIIKIRDDTVDSFRVTFKIKTIMDTPKELRLAVLIDADNVPSAPIKAMLEEIAKYGMPTFKRIYGDWTRPHLTGWKTVLLENAITPVQQYSYTVGKNSSDSALIIDAMDILYTGRVDGFCIVSSDSDFTRLATRLREAGMTVIGIGEKKTPAPFIASCNKFIYIEILHRVERIKAPARTTRARGPVQRRGANAAAERNISPVASVDQKLISLVRDNINDLTDDDEWVSLGALGNHILKKQPEFDPRNFGHKKLIDLIKSVPMVEIDERPSGKKGVTHFFVRAK